MLTLAAWILTGCGVALVGIGLFFLVARPPLLPEGVGRLHRHNGCPRGVHRNTGVRTGNAGALAVTAVAAVTSIGWMAAVNFMIRSDFRWALLGLAALWALGLFVALAAR